MESQHELRVLLTEYRQLYVWRNELLAKFLPLMYFLSTIIGGLAFAFTSTGEFLFPFMPLLLLVHVTVMMWWHYHLWSVERYLHALEVRINETANTSAPGYGRMILGDIFYKDILGSRVQGRFVKPTVMLSLFYALAMLTLIIVSLVKGYLVVRSAYGLPLGAVYLAGLACLSIVTIANYGRMPRTMTRYFDRLSDEILNGARKRNKLGDESVPCE